MHILEHLTTEAVALNVMKAFTALSEKPDDIPKEKNGLFSKDHYIFFATHIDGEKYDNIKIRNIISKFDLHNYKNISEIQKNSEKSAKYFTEWFFCAAENGDEKTIKKLLCTIKEFTIKLYETIIHSSAIKDGCTPLFIAAQNGHYETVKILLEHGATHTPKEDGATPLSIAASNGDDEVVKILLENGATHAPANNGATPLFMAALNGHDETVEILLENGATHAPANNGTTPLYFAVKKGHDKVVELLLAHGADPNTTFKRLSVLQLAINLNHHEIVKKLRQYKKPANMSLFHQAPHQTISNNQNMVAGAFGKPLIENIKNGPK